MTGFREVQIGPCRLTEIDDLQCGKAGEYLVCADLILSGIVAFPSEQGLPFDVVADVGGRLIKIQVKTTRTVRSVPQRLTHHSGYLFNVKRTGKNGSRTYREVDVDVFALVALDTKEIGYLAASQVKQTMIFRSPLMEGKYHDEMLSERSSRIRGLRESGLTYQAIANEMGLDKAFVHRVCNFKSGIPRSSRYLRNFSFAAAAKRAGYVIAPNMGDVQETIPARADGTNQLLEAE